MRHFVKIIHQFSLLVNYDKIDKTCFFLQITANSPYRKLAIKRGTYFNSYAEYKIGKLLFIYHKSVSSFVHLRSQKLSKMAMFKNSST